MNESPQRIGQRPCHGGSRPGTGFSTLGQGTPEGLWQASLALLPSFVPPKGRLLIVSPHPDDETLGTGGLIYACSRRAGYSVVVLSLTNGERSRTDIRHLGRIRASELDQAQRVLNRTPRSIIRLGLPDGALSAYESSIVDALSVLTKTPTTVFAPFSRDGHPDHEAAARAARRIGRKNGVLVFQYPIWAWHHSLPEHLDLKRASRFELSVHAQRAKAAAIRCFRTQIEDKPGGATVPRQVIQYFARPFEVFIGQS